MRSLAGAFTASSPAKLRCERTAVVRSCRTRRADVVRSSAVARTATEDLQITLRSRILTLAALTERGQLQVNGPPIP